MHSLAFVGPTSSGKTTTLTLVYGMLINEFELEVIERNQEGGDLRDFSVIMVRGELRIAMNLMGDYAKGVINCFEWAHQHGCTHLITACNEHFSQPFAHFRRNGTVIFKQLVVESSLRRHTNSAMAKSITDWVRNNP